MRNRQIVDVSASTTFLIYVHENRALSSPVHAGGRGSVRLSHWQSVLMIFMFKLTLVTK